MNLAALNHEFDLVNVHDLFVEQVKIVRFKNTFELSKFHSFVPLNSLEISKKSLIFF